jgi:hypothetical protein
MTNTQDWRADMETNKYASEDLGSDRTCPVCDKLFTIFCNVEDYGIKGELCIKGHRVNLCSFPCKREYDDINEQKWLKNHISIKEEFKVMEHLAILNKSMEREELAFVLNVKKGTIDKWSVGESTPNRKHFDRLERYYNHVT